MKDKARIGWLLAVLLGTVPRPAGAASPAVGLVPHQGKVGTKLTLWIHGSAETFLSPACELGFSPATGIAFGPIEWDASGALKTTVDIPAAATPGLQVLTISCGGEELVVPDAFEVLGQARLVSLAPGFGYLGEQVQLTVIGEYTRFGASSQLKLVPGDVTVKSLTVASPTRLEAILSIPADAAVTVHQLAVVTGAEELAWPQGFAVRAIPLVILPRQALQGQALASISLSGDGCQCQSITAADLGEGISIGSILAPSDNAITLSAVTIAANARVGRRDLTLTYPAGPLVYDNLFVVQQGPLTRLLSITPNHADAGHPGLSVELKGQNTHFDTPEPQVQLSGSGTSIYPLRSSDPTRLGATAVLSPATAQGARTVTVDVPGACDLIQTKSEAPCEHVSLPDGFTITPPGTVLALAPSPLEPGKTTTVTLTATDGQFVAGSTRLVIEPGQGVEVQSVNVLSADQLEASLVIAADASGAPRTVKAVTGTEVAIGPNLLDVYNPAIESIGPGMGVQGATALAVLVTGTDVSFDSSAKVSFGDGITPSGLTVDSAEPSRLALTLAIDEGADPGFRDVTVEVGSLSLTAPRGFKVLRKSTPDNPGDGGGCGCGASSPSPGVLGLAALGWALVRRRIQQRRGPSR